MLAQLIKALGQCTGWEALIEVCAGYHGRIEMTNDAMKAICDTGMSLCRKEFQIPEEPTTDREEFLDKMFTQTAIVQWTVAPVLALQTGQVTTWAYWEELNTQMVHQPGTAPGG